MGGKPDHENASSHRSGSGRGRARGQAKKTIEMMRETFEKNLRREKIGTRKREKKKKNGAEENRGRWPTGDPARESGG